jgi:F-type H+-transporting ATPase subunit beta
MSRTFNVFASSTQTKSVGLITQIIGPVLDVSFQPGCMPNIYNALIVEGKNESGDAISNM